MTYSAHHKRRHTSSPIVSQLAFAVHKLRANKLREDVARCGAPRASGRPVVIGFLGAKIGLGYAARLYWQALGALGYTPALVDLSDNFACLQPGLCPETKQKDDGIGPIILVVNPPEVPRALNILRQKGFDLNGRYRILACVWEQPKAPDFWANICEMFDTIWVPSQFVKSAIAHVSNVSTDVVAYPLGASEPQNIDLLDSPIDPDCFVVLSAFDDQSMRARKNPDAAIKAFMSAFGEDPTKQLVLKGSHLSESAESRLRDKIAAQKNITLYTAALDDAQMMALVGQCDATLSLSRAEGFGLLTAQSLAMGLPAIATAGTGTDEFLGSPTFLPVPSVKVLPQDKSTPYRSELGAWHDPDVEAAAAMLKTVRSQHNPQCLESRKWWDQKFSPAAVWQKISPETRHYFALSAAHKSS